MPVDDLPLFDPERHEPLTTTAWEEERVRAAIVAIASDTEAGFDGQQLWSPHPLDDEPDEPPLERTRTLYLGAAGSIRALRHLADAGAVESSRDWTSVAAELPDGYRAEPDFPDDGVVPGYLLGEAGVLLTAHLLAPSPALEERLFEVVSGNADNPARDLYWGAPGTMLVAQELHARTGEERWLRAWEASAELLWSAWEEEVWSHLIAGRPSHVLGAAHGFLGCVHALARGSLLDDARRTELERRTVTAVAHHVRSRDGLAQWPESLEWPYAGRPPLVRTQWCHGAPGLVTTLGQFAPREDALTGILVAAGELIWRAGPLAQGPGLCHGTAGNGYAFLKLFERTGDEVWLRRGRAFAMHAIEQVERAREVYGQGRYSLYTGDPGVALYLQGCLAADAEIPTLDVL